MNALEVLAGLDWWTVAGWTMLHYLWLGLAVGAVATVLRFALRRTSANVRYGAALVCLAALAVLPVGIGIWMGVGDQVLGVREGGGIDITDESATPRGAGVAARREEIAPAHGDCTLAKPQAMGDAMEKSFAPETALGVAPAPENVEPIAARPFVPWSEVGEIAARWLPWVWIVGAPVTFLLLATGVIGAERLRRESRPCTDGPILECVERLRSSLSIGRHVAVAVCERVAAPVLVGIARPLVLLPPAALTGWSPDEIEMVLLHELAHVRRWDNLINLLQRLVEAALFFQPAVWLVSGWVRREREACCDAVVVGRTQRPQAYAELLVALAAQLPRSVLFHPAASSAMAAGPLRGRIRRILAVEDDPMLISGKSLGVVMSSLLLAATLVVLNLPARSEAEQKPDLTTESTDGTEQTKDATKDVAFIEGATRFAAGDSIEITKVRGSAAEFTPGNYYSIQGKYTLASRDRAELSALISAKHSTDGTNPIRQVQTLMIFERGSGEFTLLLPMSHEGWPHVGFYPADGGKSFGGVYFGTGETVLKTWWDEKDRTAESTANAELTEPVADRRIGVGGNLPVEVSKEDERRIVAEVLQNPAVRSASIKRAPNDLQMLVTSVVPPPGKKAFLTWKTDSEGRLSCSIEFVVPPKLAEKSHSAERGRAELAPITIAENAKTRRSDEETRRVTLGIRENQTATAESESGRLRLQIRTTESAKGKFPTLEEQKLADLAWDQLGLELEAIDDAELKRVQALGYEGGLRIAGSRDAMRRSVEFIAPNFAFGEILVGLHVWPTRSLQDVAAILRRDDLEQLNPLKFYSVRQEAIANEKSQGGGRGDQITWKDRVRSGRISLNLNSRERPRPAAEDRYSVLARPDGISRKKPVLNGAETLNSSEWRDSPIRGMQSEQAMRDRPIFLLFAYHSDDERPMKQFAEVFPDLKRLNPGKIDGATIDLANDSQISASFRIVKPPTCIVYYRGREFRRYIGNVTKEQLQSAVNDIGFKMKEAASQSSVGAGNSALRYDGKTFEEWRTAWQTELSTDNRIEAVKALAAFGRAGYAKEAAVVILDVASEYDFTIIENADDPEGVLKRTVIDVLAPENRRQVMAEFWLPDLAARLEKEPARWKSLAYYLLDQLKAGPDASKTLQSLAKNGPDDVRLAALGALVRSERLASHSGKLSDSARALLAAALSSRDPIQMRQGLPLLLYDPNYPNWRLGRGIGPSMQLIYLPEFVPLLFAADESLRQQARFELSHVQDQNAGEILGKLTAVLHDDARTADHVEAIRAIAAMGPAAVAATPELKKIALESKDEDTTIAALVALASINNLDITANLTMGNFSADQLLDTLWNAKKPLLTADGEQARLKEIDDLRPRLEREAKVMFSPAGFGSGGGMF